MDWNKIFDIFRYIGYGTIGMLYFLAILGLILFGLN